MTISGLYFRASTHAPTHRPIKKYSSVPSRDSIRFGTSAPPHPPISLIETALGMSVAEAKKTLNIDVSIDNAELKANGGHYLCFSHEVAQAKDKKQLTLPVLQGLVKAVVVLQAAATDQLNDTQLKDILTKPAGTKSLLTFDLRATEDEQTHLNKVADKLKELINRSTNPGQDDDLNKLVGQALRVVTKSELLTFKSDIEQWFKLSTTDAQHILGLTGGVSPEDTPVHQIYNALLNRLEPSKTPRTRDLDLETLRGEIDAALVLLASTNQLGKHDPSLLKANLTTAVDTATYKRLTEIPDFAYGITGIKPINGDSTSGEVLESCLQVLRQFNEVPERSSTTPRLRSIPEAYYIDNLPIIRQIISDRLIRTGPLPDPAPLRAPSFPPPPPDSVMPADPEGPPALVKKLGLSADAAREVLSLPMMVVSLRDIYGAFLDEVPTDTADSFVGLETKLNAALLLLGESNPDQVCAELEKSSRKEDDLSALGITKKVDRLGLWQAGQAKLNTYPRNMDRVDDSTIAQLKQDLIRIRRALNQKDRSRKITIASIIGAVTVILAAAFGAGHLSKAGFFMKHPIFSSTNTRSNANAADAQPPREASDSAEPPITVVDIPTLSVVPDAVIVSDNTDASVATVPEIVDAASTPTVDVTPSSTADVGPSVTADSASTLTSDVASILPYSTAPVADVPSISQAPIVISNDTGPSTVPTAPPAPPPPTVITPAIPSPPPPVVVVQPVQNIVANLPGTDEVYVGEGIVCPSATNPSPFQGLTAATARRFNLEPTCAVLLNGAHADVVLSDESGIIQPGNPERISRLEPDERRVGERSLFWSHISGHHLPRGRVVLPASGRRPESSN